MSSSKQYSPKTTAQPTPKQSDCRATAHAIASRGLSVHPLKPRSKTAVLRDWPNLATTDEAQITTWFDELPGINYGILANEKVCFIDVDPRNGGLETFARLEAEEPEFAQLFRTLTVETGRRDGGRHFYFRPPKGWKLRQGKDALGPGVDVLLWRKYVVGPGSVHPDTGKPYRCVNPNAEIAPLPSWVILKLLEGRNETMEEEHASTLLSGTSVTISPSPSLDDQTLSQVRETVRGYLRDGLLTPEAFDALIHEPVWCKGRWSCF